MGDSAALFGPAARWRVRRRSRASILSGDKKVPERSRKSRERLGWRTHQQSRRLRLFHTIHVRPRFNFSPRPAKRDSPREKYTVGPVFNKDTYAHLPGTLA